jgi:hypothetical protein
MTDNTKKRCPLLLDEYGSTSLDCIKDKCAIFETITGTCGLMTVGYLMAFQQARKENGYHFEG